MARITVEDCLENVDNRFDLVLFATKRARQLANGVEPLIPWANDKPTVVALREIAGGVLTQAAVDAVEREREQRRAERSLEMRFAEQFSAELGAEDNL